MKVKIVKSKEYYNQFNDMIMSDQKKVDYHIAQAAYYKRLYTLTKGRRGIYALLNRLAQERNRHHTDVAHALCLNDMAQLMTEIVYLTKYIIDKEKES